MKYKYSKNLRTALLSILILGLIECKSDRDDSIKSTISENTSPQALEKSYHVNRFNVLNIEPNLQKQNNYKLTWLVDGKVISQNQVLEFISPETKTYALTLKVENNGIVNTYTSSIFVDQELVPYSKYISKVFDFRPAVGQFINSLPKYITGDTYDIMRQKAQKSLVGENSEGVSLGGFGGYVIFGFDHTIPNLDGRDFKILGNAFWSNLDDFPRAGSSEPGIVMVAYDKNKNGKPDDNEWYEIAGSEYFKNTTLKNYQITYFKPDENKVSITGTDFWQSDIEYLKWQDNMGESGYKTKNSFHNQSYYPLWISDASYSFTGTKLPNNFIDVNGDGSYWVGKSYEYGYADNVPNDDEASNIDISWTVDKNGNYVKLPGIDFVKIYTGINQEAGWLGEVSTEVAGAYDLRLK